MNVKQLLPTPAIIGIIIASVVIFATILIVMLANAPNFQAEVNGDTYSLNGIKIPTIEKAIGERRHATNIKIGAGFKSFTYTGMTAILNDIESYLECLVRDYGYEVIYEENRGTFTDRIVLFKEDTIEGKKIMVEIICDVNKYTIRISEV